MNQNAFIVLIIAASCLVAFLLVGIGKRQENPPTPQPLADKKQDSSSAITSASTPKKPTVPAIPSPVAKPEKISSELIHSVSEPKDTSQAKALNELQTLATKPRDDEKAQALRWLIYQPDRGEIIRNQALVVLSAWDVDWLESDLERMMLDLGQSTIWRAYCVQHLKHHFAKHQDKPSYDALVKGAKSGSEDLSTVRESAVYALACLAKEQDWKTTQPEHYQETLPLIEGAITSPMTGTTVAGIRSAAVLELKDHAPTLEAIAADEKQALEIRIAAVQALGAIGRPESKPILEKCAQSAVKTMAQVAMTALKQSSDKHSK